MEERKIAVRTSLAGMLLNIILAILKYTAGILAGSAALISDAVDSASDIFSNIIVLIGIRASSKSEDNIHQYGHERLECVAAMVIAIILGVTGIGIGYAGVQKIISGLAGNLAAPGYLAVLIAAVAITAKIFMFRYVKGVAIKIGSSVLIADAYHHRSDALSSISSLVGVTGAILGFPILDPIASLVICGLILKSAFDIAKDAFSKMVDTSCDAEMLQGFESTILHSPDVIAIDMLKTRKFASKVYVDLEISVCATISLISAHQIAERVHDSLEQSYPEIKHCMVHVNPYNAE